ncbi:MAG TPA: hypothetical protein VD859_10940 [Nocardioides sp.]|nr:hypothetical protein [Nocardioides sp.]
MTRLLKVELTRLLCRRAVLVLLAVALVAPVVTGVATALNTRPPSDSEVARAERLAERDAERPRTQRMFEKCMDDPERHLGRAAGDVEAACEEAYLPQPEWYVYWESLDLVAERQEGSGVVLLVVLGIAMMLAGATFAGHDWASGSVSNQLLFEPRRVRVWVAKAVAVTAVPFAVVVVVMTAYWLFLGWLARSRDIAVPEGLLLDCLQAGWRGAAVVAAIALGGYALTMLFRSTVAALGILLALGIAGGMILAVIGIGSIWNPGLNALAVVLDGATYWETAPCGPESPGSTCEVERTLSLERGSAFTGVLLAVALAASVWSFRRRDVG